MEREEVVKSQRGERHKALGLASPHDHTGCTYVYVRALINLIDPVCTYHKFPHIYILLSSKALIYRKAGPTMGT